MLMDCFVPRNDSEGKITEKRDASGGPFLMAQKWQKRLFSLAWSQSYILIVHLMMNTKKSRIGSISQVLFENGYWVILVSLTSVPKNFFDHVGVNIDSLDINRVLRCSLKMTGKDNDREDKKDLFHLDFKYQIFGFLKNSDMYQSFLIFYRVLIIVFPHKLLFVLVF